MSAYRGAAVRSIDETAAAAIYDLRLLVEPEALRRAVRESAACGAASWPLAAGALAAAAAAAGQAQRSLANREFHRALYLGCGNPLDRQGAG